MPRPTSSLDCRRNLSHTSSAVETKGQTEYDQGDHVRSSLVVVLFRGAETHPPVLHISCGTCGFPSTTTLSEDKASWTLSTSTFVVIPGCSLILVLRLLNTEWGLRCVSLIQHFFSSVLEAIREDRDADAETVVVRAAGPGETHLGLSRERARGVRSWTGTCNRRMGSALGNRGRGHRHLHDLEETALLIPGIDKDRVSDIAANIIREPLIEYTQQVEQYGIPLRSEVDSGPGTEMGMMVRFERLPVTRGSCSWSPRQSVEKKLDFSRRVPEPLSLSCVHPRRGRREQRVGSASQKRGTAAADEGAEEQWDDQAVRQLA